VRVLVDLADRAGELFAVVSTPARAVPERPVRWTAGRRLLVAKDEPVGDAEAAALATAVDLGRSSAAELERYGRLLFEAAFGAQTWRELVTDAAGSPYLELAVRGPAGQGQADQEQACEGQAAAAGLQALRWEALHDGTAHVAAKGAATDPETRHRRGALSVGIVRLVPLPPPVLQNEAGLLSPISRIPRVLFAVGSRLTDPRVRPGAEFMGILRHLERRGGSIQARVLESASAPSLARELERFQPDVLHVIGHGRWFPVDQCVKLQLRAEQPEGGDEYVTAGQLLDVFAEAAHMPTVVMLSACQTGAAAPGAAPVNALPFAAQLVAGGVLVVVAMAGDISDTACRVFTRSLTQAIGEGGPLVEAVIRGRRAAFHARPDLDSADWLLPAVFLADHVASESRLVDTGATRAARDRIRDLDFDWEPVFCGRGIFIEAMDRLLDGDDPLNVLVACTPDPGKSYGGMRLLRELGARAVREGRLPVLLGPFDEDPPTDRAQLAEALSDKLDEMRDNLGLAPKQNRIVETAGPGAKRPQVVRAIRAAFEELVADLPAGDPVLASPEPRVVLLCHRVDQWQDALDDLLGMIGQKGLSPGAYPVPVVLTGADTGELAHARLVRYNGAAWAKFAPLGRFRDHDDDPEDILAYQWWLLNPPERTAVYVPRRGVGPGWQGQLRWVMRKVIYDEDELFGFARASSVFFSSEMDGDVLESYRRAAQ
jgi:hypothetical protein